MYFGLTTLSYFFILPLYLVYRKYLMIISLKRVKMQKVDLLAITYLQRNLHLKLLWGGIRSLQPKTLNINIHHYVAHFKGLEETNISAQGKRGIYSYPFTINRNINNKCQSRKKSFILYYKVFKSILYYLFTIIEYIYKFSTYCCHNFWCYSNAHIHNVCKFAGLVNNIDIT